MSNTIHHRGPLRGDFVRKALSGGLLALIGALAPAQAATFASSVANVSGAFSASNGTGPDPDGALVTLGAPDGRFIQLFDDSSITLDFGALVSVPAVLRVYSVDQAFPAAARIEVSADNVSFSELLEPSGGLWYDDNPAGHFDVNFSATRGSRFRYVRFTDLPPALDGDTTIAGFDLDAVSLSPVPEPSTTALMAVGLLAVIAGLRRRQSLRCSVGALALSAATCASAGPLLPGGSTATTGITAFDAPHLAAVFVRDQLVPFSFASPSGLVTGSIVQTVVRSTMDNTLDFYWQISLDASSASGLSSLAIQDFMLPSGSPLWADYRTDGIGDIGSSTAKRSPGVGSQIIFEFNAIAPGQTTEALLLDTQVTAFALDGSMRLQALEGSQSPSMPAFVPAPVPEPATYGLLGLGLAALAFTRRSRTSPRTHRPASSPG